MPGGYKNINGSDGNTFEKGNKYGEKWTEEVANELADELIEWIKSDEKENMFFKEFLLLKKGLYPDLLKYLARVHPSFSEKLDLAKEIQKVKLIKYGVDDKLNPAMTKFVLMNQHGMAEKMENENKDTYIELSKEEREKRKKELIKKLKS